MTDLSTDSLFTQIDTMVNAMISANVAPFVSYITPIVSVCACLFFTYKAFQYYYQPPDIPIMDILKMYMAWLLVFTLALNSGTYISDIVPIITGTGDEIANAFSGSSSLGASIDDTLIQILEAIKIIWKSSSGVSGTLFAVACIAILIIGCTPLLVTAISYIILAKILLGVSAILGVVYICFLFFPVTRGMFFQWLSTVVGYILLIGVIGIVLNLIFSFINEFILPPLKLKGEDTAYLSSLLWVAIVMYSFNIVMGNLLGMVQSISGGAGVSGGSNLASAMMGGRATKAMAKMTGKGITNLGGKAWNQTGGRATTALKNMLKGALGG